MHRNLPIALDARAICGSLWGCIFLSLRPHFGVLTMAVRRPAVMTAKPKAPKKKPVVRKKPEPSNFMVIHGGGIYEIGLTLQNAKNLVTDQVEIGYSPEDFQIVELKFNCEPLEPKVRFLEVK